MNNKVFAFIYFAVSAQNLAYSELSHSSFSNGASLRDSRSNESQQTQVDMDNQVMEISEESPTESPILAEQDESSYEYSSNEKSISKSSEPVVSPNDNEVISHSQAAPSPPSTLDKAEETISPRRENSTAKFSAVHTAPVSTTIQSTSQADSEGISPAPKEESTTQPKRKENLVSNGDENKAKTRDQPNEQSLRTTAATTATKARLEEKTVLITKKLKATTAPPRTNDKKCKNRLSVKRCKRLRKYFRTIDACKRIHAMRKYCKKYCGLCERMQDKKAHRERKKRARKNCKDFSRVLCRRFSAFCTRESKNGRVMRHYCKRTCEQC